MRFLKSSHQYFRGSVEYKPVSTWIDQFKKPFPAETIANKIAKGDMAVKKDTLNKWELKRDMMANYGSSGHQAVEYFIKYDEMPDQPNLANIVNRFVEVIGSDNKLHSELIGTDDERKIAGTIDILEALGNKEVNIWDLKFCGDIHKKGHNKLLTPFEDLRDSKLTIYALQLSMYKHLAECMGLKVKKTGILWWNGKSFDKIMVEPKEKIMEGNVELIRQIDLTKAL